MNSLADRIVTQKTKGMTRLERFYRLKRRPNGIQYMRNAPNGAAIVQIPNNNNHRFPKMEIPTLIHQF